MTCPGGSPSRRCLPFMREEDVIRCHEERLEVKEELYTALSEVQVPLPKPIEEPWKRGS